MAEKRRDSKNRVLKTGESQRKDGRYMYKYTDVDGKVKYEYSWKLVPTDKMPAGKKDEPCLRDKIKEVEKRLEAGLNSRGAQMTVLELVDLSIELRNLKRNTKQAYLCARNRIANSQLAHKKIEAVKVSDGRAFVKWLTDKGLKSSSIQGTCAVLRKAFDIAMEDNMLSRNPMPRSVTEALQKNAKKRNALSEAQVESFLGILKGSKTGRKSYDAAVILFETGIRISELAGLQIDDVDMENRRVNIRGQLASNREIVPTKSTAGVRTIPMSDMAYMSFARILAERKNKAAQEEYQNFLMINRNGEPAIPETWRVKFRTCSAKWMKEKPEIATEVSPHVCRHTFCTRLIMKGVNPKIVQYLMGHETSGVTMDVYTHVEFEQAEEAFRKAAEA